MPSPKQTPRPAEGCAVLNRRHFTLASLAATAACGTKPRGPGWPETWHSKLINRAVKVADLHLDQPAGVIQHIHGPHRAPRRSGSGHRPAKSNPMPSPCPTRPAPATTAAYGTRSLGPGYRCHARLFDCRVHPTRESAEYALYLLEEGSAPRVQRAKRIIERVLALQVTEPGSQWYGLWGWYQEEPPDRMALAAGEES